MTIYLIHHSSTIRLQHLFKVQIPDICTKCHIHSSTRGMLSSRVLLCRFGYGATCWLLPTVSRISGKGDVCFEDTLAGFFCGICQVRAVFSMACSRLFQFSALLCTRWCNFLLLGLFSMCAASSRR